jgi:cytochrome P450
MDESKPPSRSMTKKPSQRAKTIVRPPGPVNRSLLGNLAVGSKDPLGRLSRWAREYGDIVYYRSLRRHVYFLNHPELLKSVLLTHYQNFTKSSGARVYRRLLGNGLITNSGESWLSQRRLVQPAFQHSRIGAYGALMVEHTEALMREWKDGEVRDIQEDMLHLGLEIVTQALFEVQIAADSKKIATALRVIKEESSSLRLVLPPGFRFIPTRGNFRYEQAARQLDEVVQRLIRERRASGSLDGDVLSALMRAQAEDGAAMTDAQLRDEIKTLMVAGHETTAVSLSWTWYLLAQHPEMRERLWAELDRVLGGRSPTVEDLPNMVFTDAVAKEAMRLYPPVWALVRSPIKDCEIGGYVVPADSTILMSQWVMHRDPRFYSEPEQFRPERWLDKTWAAGLKLAYFPFGGGPRSCVGSGFATMEIVLALATIAKRFQLDLEPGWCAETKLTMTLRPKNGIRVVIRKRTEHAAAR